MKKVLVLAVVVAAALGIFAACGGSGGSSGNCDTAKTTAETSFEAMGALLDDPAIQACAAMEDLNCDCPGGGTAVANPANFTLTLTSCKSATGATFSGTVQLSADQTSVDANMSTFDACTNVVATDILTDGCGGTVTGTCGGVNLSCTLGLNPNDPNDCMLTCSC